MICPNIKSQEWINLVGRVGIDSAYLLFNKYDGNYESIYEQIKPEKSESSQVDYSLKTTKVILDNSAKILSWENNKSISSELLWKKIQDLGVPTQQLNLLKDSEGNTVLEKLISFISNYSNVIEINTVKETVILESLYPNGQYGNTYSDEYFETKDGLYRYSFIENEFTFSSDNKIKVISYEEFEAAKSKITPTKKPSSYYSNLTVPGGINYIENEIATPAVTPAIKGHAQFSTDKGIGWFRSDDKLDYKQEDLQVVADEVGLPISKLNSQSSEFANSTPTKTRRILEVQSDLFQKGRDKEDLITKYAEKLYIEETNLANTPYVVLDAEGNTKGLFKTKSEADLFIYKDGNDKSPSNQFLQFLNKDNNWVTFFIKSIVQDSIKKGYERVLLPTGNTVSKIEGHTSLEEFKSEKQDRIEYLESRIKYQKENITDVTERDKNIDKFNNEINQLKQELERVDREGFGSLKPIYNFYENVIGNVLKKQGFNPKTITDEFGNTWYEVELNKDLSDIFLQTTSESNQQLTQDFANKVESFITSIPGFNIERVSGLSYNGAVDFKNRIVELADGKRLSAIGEEAAHILWELHKDQDTKDKILKEIIKTKYYQQVFEEYSTIYVTPDGKPDINKIKNEAAGKVISIAISDAANGTSNLDKIVSDKIASKNLLETLRRLVDRFVAWFIGEPVVDSIKRFAEDVYTANVENIDTTKLQTLSDKFYQLNPELQSLPNIYPKNYTSFIIDVSTLLTSKGLNTILLDEIMDLSNRDVNFYNKVFFTYSSQDDFDVLSELLDNINFEQTKIIDPSQLDDYSDKVLFVKSMSQTSRPNMSNVTFYAGRKQYNPTLTQEELEQRFREKLTTQLEQLDAAQANNEKPKLRKLVEQVKSITDYISRNKADVDLAIYDKPALIAVKALNDNEIATSIENMLKSIDVLYGALRSLDFSEVDIVLNSNDPLLTDVNAAINQLQYLSKYTLVFSTYLSDLSSNLPGEYAEYFSTKKGVIDKINKEIDRKLEKIISQRLLPEFAELNNNVVNEKQNQITSLLDQKSKLTNASAISLIDAKISKLQEEINTKVDQITSDVIVAALKGEVTQVDLLSQSILTARYSSNPLVSSIQQIVEKNKLETQVSINTWLTSERENIERIGKDLDAVGININNLQELTDIDVHADIFYNTETKRYEMKSTNVKVHLNQYTGVQAANVQLKIDLLNLEEDFKNGTINSNELYEARFRRLQEFRKDFNTEYTDEYYAAEEDLFNSEYMNIRQEIKNLESDIEDLEQSIQDGATDVDSIKEQIRLLRLELNDKKLHPDYTKKREFDAKFKETKLNYQKFNKDLMSLLNQDLLDKNISPKIFQNIKKYLNDDTYFNENLSAEELESNYIAVGNVIMEKLNDKSLTKKFWSENTSKRPTQNFYETRNNLLLKLNSYSFEINKDKYLYSSDRQDVIDRFKQTEFDRKVLPNYDNLVIEDWTPDINDRTKGTYYVQEVDHYTPLGNETLYIIKDYNGFIIKNRDTNSVYGSMSEMWDTIFSYTSEFRLPDGSIDTTSMVEQVPDVLKTLNEYESLIQEELKEILIDTLDTPIQDNYIKMVKLRVSTLAKALKDLQEQVNTDYFTKDIDGVFEAALSKQASVQELKDLGLYFYMNEFLISNTDQRKSLLANIAGNEYIRNLIYNFNIEDIEAFGDTEFTPEVREVLLEIRKRFLVKYKIEVLGSQPQVSSEIGVAYAFTKIIPRDDKDYRVQLDYRYSKQVVKDQYKNDLEQVKDVTGNWLPKTNAYTNQKYVDLYSSTDARSLALQQANNYILNNHINRQKDILPSLRIGYRAASYERQLYENNPIENVKSGIWYKTFLNTKNRFEEGIDNPDTNNPEDNQSTYRRFIDFIRGKVDAEDVRVASTVERPNVQRVRTDAEGFEQKVIPVSFGQVKDPNQVSNDLLTSSLLYAEASKKSDNLSNVTPLYNIITHVMGLEENKPKEVSDRIAKVNFIGNLVKSRSENATKEQIDQYIDTEIYGKNRHKQIPDKLKIFLDTLVKMRVFKSMSTLVNPANNVKNYISGQLQGVINGGRLFSRKLFAKESAKSFKRINKYIYEITSGSKPSKDTVIFNMFNDKSDRQTLINGRYGNLNRQLNGTFGLGKLSMFGQEYGEMLINDAYLFSTLKHQKIELSNGKKVSIYDALIQNADGTIEPIPELSWDKIFQIIRELKNFRYVTQGQTDEKTQFEKTDLGGYIMMFRKYFPIGLLNRYNYKKRLNLATGEYEKGYYYETGYVFKLLLRNTLIDVKYGLSTWSTLTDKEKRSVAKTLTDLAMVFALQAILSLGFDYDDDDPDKFKKLKDNSKLVNFVIYQMLMVQSETRQLGLLGDDIVPPVVAETGRTVNTVTVLYSIFKEMLKFIDDFSDYAVDNPDAYYNKPNKFHGIKKGDVKWQHTLSKLSGYQGLKYTASGFIDSKYLEETTPTIEAKIQAYVTQTNR